MEVGQRGAGHRAELQPAVRRAHRGRRLERLLGPPLERPAPLPPGPGHAPARRPAREPLPEPPRADAQGPDGQEREAVAARAGPRQAARGLRLRARDAPPAGGLLALRRGVPAVPARDVDHEAGERGAGPGHLPRHEAPPAPEVVRGPLGRDEGERVLRHLALRRPAAPRRRPEVRPAALRARDVVPAAARLQAPRGLRALLHVQVRPLAGEPREPLRAPDERGRAEARQGLQPAPRRQVEPAALPAARRGDARPRGRGAALRGHGPAHRRLAARRAGPDHQRPPLLRVLRLRRARRRRPEAVARRGERVALAVRDDARRPRHEAGADPGRARRRAARGHGGARPADARRGGLRGALRRGGGALRGRGRGGEAPEAGAVGGRLLKLILALAPRELRVRPHAAALLPLVRLLVEDPVAAALPAAAAAPRRARRVPRVRRAVAPLRAQAQVVLARLGRPREVDHDAAGEARALRGRRDERRLRVVLGVELERRAAAGAQAAVERGEEAVQPPRRRRRRVVVVAEPLQRRDAHRAVERAVAERQAQAHVVLEELRRGVRGAVAGAAVRLLLRAVRLLRAVLLLLLLLLLRVVHVLRLAAVVVPRRAPRRDPQHVAGHVAADPRVARALERRAREAAPAADVDHEAPRPGREVQQLHAARGDLRLHANDAAARRVLGRLGGVVVVGRRARGLRARHCRAGCLCSGVVQCPCRLKTCGRPAHAASEEVTMVEEKRPTRAGDTSTYYYCPEQLAADGL